MIISKTSLLGTLIIAVKNGKRISHINSLNTEKRTVTLATGQTYQVDYFVAYQTPAYLQKQMMALGIETTRHVTNYIKSRSRLLKKERQSKKYKSDEKAVA